MPATGASPDRTLPPSPSALRPGCCCIEDAAAANASSHDLYFVHVVVETHMPEREQKEKASSGDENWMLATLSFLQLAVVLDHTELKSLRNQS